MKKNKILWIGLALTVALVAWYLLKKRKAKEETATGKLNLPDGTEPKATTHTAFSYGGKRLVVPGFGSN